MENEENVDPLDLEQVANVVVHPVIKETITKYKYLIEDPITRGVQIEAMTKELGRLAQGYKKTKGTNTYSGIYELKRNCANFKTQGNNIRTNCS